MFSPIEKRFPNPSYSGNPFDLIATAQFTHTATDETITTELYYLESDTWAFKFTGTKPGAWSYITKSSDPDLDGKRGTFTVVAQTNTKITGFLTHSKNRFAVPDHEGNLKAYLFNVYMNLEDFRTVSTFKSQSKIDAYLDEAQNNGFKIVYLSIGPSNWMTDRSGDVDPELETFEVLESLVSSAHERGMRVHLWAWGDREGSSTPDGYSGGINGPVDRRLQRYIAARLGPMPGWTMGYGYDLHEWVSGSQLESWARFMHEKMGYDHLLSARSHEFSGSRTSVINSYEGVGRSVELTTSPYGPADYDEVLKHMNSDTSRPHMYEERHTYLRPNYDLDMDGTRRLLWWQAMSGGLGGFYGFYRESSSSVFRGFPYPRPEQLRAFSGFWDERFDLDLRTCNGLTDGVSLCAPGESYVFYKENTNRISMDLSGMGSRSFTVTAMDTKTGSYRDIGTKTSSYTRFDAPHTSDWVVHVQKT